MSAAAHAPDYTTSSFFQNLTREEAEAALHERPMHPILRPCSYTSRNPRIHAITLRESFSTPIRHFLVELDPSGSIYEVEVRGEEFVRGRCFADMAELEANVRQMSRRLWLHTSSIQTEPVAVSTSHLHADLVTILSSATVHHSTTVFHHSTDNDDTQNNEDNNSIDRTDSDTFETLLSFLQSSTESHNNEEEMTG